MLLSLLFIGMALFGCFYGLGAYGVLDNNEGMYAAIARDMLHGSSLIVPHLNGVPYLEKPPLLYWLSAGSMDLFGEAAWAARLPVALATYLLAGAMVLFLAGLTRRRAGLIAGLIFVTCPVILIIGRTVYCDMLLTAGLSVGLMAFYRWYGNGQRRWLCFSYAMLALAVLSKGFIAIILAGGTAFIFLLLEKKWTHMRRAFDPVAIGVFLLIAAPWHIAATMQENGFAWFYFINEHLLRFIGVREPLDYYRGPMWYYLPRILLLLFPWTLLLPLLARRKDEPTPDEATRALTRFLGIWFLLVLAFFSLASAKANYYLIAGMPPLVLLLALRVDVAMQERHNMRLWGWTAAALLLTAILIGLLPLIGSFKAEDSSFLNKIFTTLRLPHDAIPALALTLAAIILCRAKRFAPEVILLLMSLPTALLLPLLLSAAHLNEPMISQRQTGWELSMAGNPDVALYHDFEEVSSLAFYLKAPIAVISSMSSDLAYGMKKGQRPDLFPTLTQWYMAHPDGAIIVRTRFLGVLEREYAMLPGPPHLCIEKQFPVVTILRACP